jgi:hypothetical protein
LQCHYTFEVSNNHKKLHHRFEKIQGKTKV